MNEDTIASNVIKKRVTTIECHDRYDLINQRQANGEPGHRTMADGSPGSGTEGIQTARASPRMTYFDAEQVPFPLEYRAGDEYEGHDSTETSDADEQSRSFQNYVSEDEEEELYRIDVDENGDRVWSNL